MVFTGHTSMLSTIFSEGGNFGSSFDSWKQLQHLAYFEADLRNSLQKHSLIFNEQWAAFRYLYLGKFFSLEHQFRSARNNPHLEHNLQRLAERILTQYSLQLNARGIYSIERMSGKDFLFFPFRNPLRRFFLGNRKRLFKTLDVSL